MLASEGVTIVDSDFSRPAEHIGDFYLVTCLAVIEHLADSPRALLENLRAHAPNGLVVLDVPNIAYWPNRVKLMRGETVHQDIDAVYDSEPPFTGHHREYTESDLRRVMERSGHEVVALESFNYSIRWREFGVRGLARWGLPLVPSLLPGCREVLMVAGRPA